MRSFIKNFFFSNEKQEKKVTIHGSSLIQTDAT